jgi:hypothetical protein
MSIPSYVVLNDLPPPVTTGGIQGFIDVYGEQWVAKPGVYGGVWRKARDVLHGIIYRASNFTMTTAMSTVAFDTVYRDVYGMAALPGFALPVAGWYRMYATCNAVSNAAAQWVQVNIISTVGGTVITHAASNNTTTTSGGISARCQITIWRPAGAVITVQSAMAAALGGQTAVYNTRLEISYVGTG